MSVKSKDIALDALTADLAEENENLRRELVEAQGRITELEHRLEVEPEFPDWDGIACRDETIRLFEDLRQEMKQELSAERARADHLSVESRRHHSAQLAAVDRAGALEVELAREREARERAEKDLEAVYEFFHIGSLTRNLTTLMTNLENTKRRAECLCAIEKEFFSVPIDSDDYCHGEEPDTECLMRWGSDPGDYVDQFREALKALYLNASQKAIAAAEAERDEARRRLEDVARLLPAIVVRYVAELPDRDSPDDNPDIMLVTERELAESVADAIEDVISSLAEAQPTTSPEPVSSSVVEPPIPAIGSRWLHKNGKVYVVEEIRNLDADPERRHDYPIVVCYRQEYAGSKWAKPLTAFLRSRTLVDAPAGEWVAPAKPSEVDIATLGELVKESLSTGNPLTLTPEQSENVQASIQDAIICGMGITRISVADVIKAPDVKYIARRDWMPEDAEWVAWDKDGWQFEYKVEPKHDGNVQWWTGSRTDVLSLDHKALIWHGKFPGDWRDSLHRVADKDEHDLPVIPRPADAPEGAKYQSTVLMMTAHSKIAQTVIGYSNKYHPVDPALKWHRLEDFNPDH